MLRKTGLTLLGLLLVTPSLALAHGGVDDGELIIRMTKNGFEPKELTVVENDTVLFINNDDVERWPASNFHPTHTLYPEFDPLTGIAPGASWKMTFEKPGTWRLHDHLIPHLTGTIIVLEDAASSTTTSSAAEEPGGGWWEKLKTFLAKIFKARNSGAVKVDSRKLEAFTRLNAKEQYAWLEEVTRQENSQTAWQYVVEAYSRPDALANAHDLAHLVGQLLFKEHGFESFSFCSPAFAFGCYHGIMEVAFEGNSPAEYRQNILAAEKGCGKLGDETSSSYWSCIHGIGHGTITFREHRAQEALDDCDALTERMRTYCYDGVFMELSTSAAPNFYRPSDPLYPCDAIKKDYRSACARSQSRVMRSRLGLDTAQIAALCEKSDEVIHYHCIDSLGYFMGQSYRGRPEEVVAGCAAIASVPDRAQCLAAAAGELVFQNATDWREASRKICASLDGPYRQSCEERVRQVEKSYGR